MNRWCVAIFSIGSMLTVTINSAVTQDRVQAGTLVCNTSMDLGVIVGSREALNCTFTPSVPGPTQSYNGTITSSGLTLERPLGASLFGLSMLRHRFASVNSQAPMRAPLRRPPLA
jgi:hypothetical protein